MSSNKADILYDIILEFLVMNTDTYHKKASGALSELYHLAEPQADELRTMRKRVERLRLALSSCKQNSTHHDHEHALETIHRISAHAIEEDNE